MPKKTEDAAAKLAKAVAALPKAKYKFPKTLAACADRYADLKDSRLAAQKDVDKIEEEEKALKEHLIALLPKVDASGISGKHHRVTVKVKHIPTIEDPTLFYAGVAKKKAWDLLQRRLSESAVQERWDAGETIPGVGTITVYTLSLNKL